MGLRFYRRVRLGKGLSLNVSKKGVSVSAHAGPLSVSSRGNVNVRLAPGLSYHTKSTASSPKRRKPFYRSW